jgi:DnaJ-class molecular chaperone
MKKGYVVCPECKGNGFVKVPYEQAREEQHANCPTCGAQGEVLDKDTEKYVEELKSKL